jgi:hypothetical protein
VNRSMRGFWGYGSQSERNQKDVPNQVVQADAWPISHTTYWKRS